MKKYNYEYNVNAAINELHSQWMTGLRDGVILGICHWHCGYGVISVETEDGVPRNFNPVCDEIKRLLNQDSC